MSKKQSAQPQNESAFLPGEIFEGPPEHLSTADVFGESDTAIGIASFTGWTKRKVRYSLDEVRAELTPPPAPPPEKPKPAPQTCPSIFSLSELPKTIPNPSEIVAGAGELADLITSNYLHFSPLPFLGGLGFADPDLIEAVLPSYGPQIKKFAVLKNDLNKGVFSKMTPNIFEMDREPKRKWLVLRFPAGVNLQAQGKRIAYLKRFGHLAALILDSQQLALEGWFFVGDLSKVKLERLGKTAVEVGADPKCLLKNWRACVPGAPVISGHSVFQTMRDLKLVKDADHLNRLGMRNFCLYLDLPQ